MFVFTVALFPLQREMKSVTHLGKVSNFGFEFTKAITETTGEVVNLTLML